MTQSGSPRLGQDLIRLYDLPMRHLDSSLGAFAITSQGVHCTCASLLYWSLRCMVLFSCASGRVIVVVKGCYESGHCDPPLQKSILRQRLILYSLFRVVIGAVTWHLIYDRIRHLNWGI